jgi:hypothetical protein
MISSSQKSELNLLNSSERGTFRFWERSKMHNTTGHFVFSIALQVLMGVTSNFNPG